jgi:hypothetical protein
VRTESVPPRVCFTRKIKGKERNRERERERERERGSFFLLTFSTSEEKRRKGIM